MSNTQGRHPQTAAQGKTPTHTTNKKKKKSSLRRFGRILLTAFLIGVITCTLVGGAAALYIINYVKPQNIDINKLACSTVLYANDGKTRISEVSGKYNRIWVNIDKIPQNLQNAFVCTEDKRFYEHEGVDWIRTVGSFGNLFLHFWGGRRQGGSTITQQLVNNVTAAGKKDKDWARKIHEIVDALDVEKKYSKSQILEAYVNTIYLDEGYGVETASENFFGKSVSKLDLAECATLAAMPKAPYTYDPRIHPKNSASRRKSVLLNMLNQDKITRKQYDQAVKEKLKLAPKKSQSTRSWFADMVVSDVQKDLEKKYGWTADAAIKEIYTRGLKIYTTEDTKVQKAMDKVYQDTNYKYWYKYPNNVQPQSGMMTVDYTGQIVGVEGGRGKKSGNMLFDRANMAKRSPGSSIKPLAVYSPAIELNKITWSTLISRNKIMLSDGSYWPENDGNDGYNGYLTVTDALAMSVNTVAVNIENDYLSPTYSFNFLTQKLGFTTLVDSRTDKKGNVLSDKNLGIAIGSLTDGVTVREMAGGYEIFGNGGVYYTPHSYTKVVDNSGNVLLQYNSKGTQALSADTASVMNKLLQQNVLDSYGTCRNASLGGSVEIGGKTGTTDSHKDRWFCGITPNYVGVAWVGYDNQKGVEFYGADNPSLVAWKSVMEQVEANPKKTQFDTSSGVFAERYSPYTGCITDSGSATGWYKSSVDLPTTPTVALPPSKATTSSTTTKKPTKKPAKKPVKKPTSSSTSSVVSTVTSSEQPESSQPIDSSDSSSDSSQTSSE